jgi:hypothetical protein
VHFHTLRQYLLVLLLLQIHAQKFVARLRLSSIDNITDLHRHFSWMRHVYD